MNLPQELDKNKFTSVFVYVPLYHSVWREYLLSTFDRAHIVQQYDGVKLVT